MRKRLLSVLVGAGFVLSTLMLLPQGVSAQNSLLPEEITNFFDLFGEDGSLTTVFVTSRVRVALVIALGILVLVAVVYSLMAAFKYIQSQGDPGKIEEAQKAIKAIFMGVAAMMIGIVGIVLVFVFFAVTRPDASLFQVCLSAPSSSGCASCMQVDGSDPTLCEKCEEEYRTEAPTSAECLPNNIFAPIP